MYFFLHRYDAKADLWSAGAVLFEMIAGRPPFHGENHIDLLRNIQRRAVRLPAGVKVSAECVNILRLLLNRNPLSRSSFPQFFDATNAFVALGCNGPEPKEFSVSDRLGALPGNLVLHASMTLDKIAEEDLNFDNGEYCSQPQTAMSKQNCCFSPLIPSPPGPTACKAQTMPPTFSLEPSMTRNIPNVIESTAVEELQVPVTSALRRQTQVNIQAVSQQCVSTLSGSLSQSEGDEFVMVEHQLGTTTTSASSRAAFVGASSPFIAPNKNARNLNNSPSKARQQISSSAYQRFRGLLSTSPSTGGKLMGALVSRQAAGVSPPVDHTQNLDTSQRIWERKRVYPNNLEAAVKMLAVAEDVGRRAIHVAHLGDTRAYKAMRVLMAVSMAGSCGSEMEGIEDTGSLGSKCTGLSKYPTNALAKTVRDQDEDNDEEMPFALSPVDSTRENYHAITPERDIQCATAHAHFREALSCYMKALPLMKGAVTATQRVLESMKTGHNVDGTPVADQKSCFLLASRCRLSLQWLASQFTGVVERADAASQEIVRQGTHLQAIHQKEFAVVSVEELIYNHALACGKDGAVKQLLGHYDAARLCYRSAAMLAETLLMEKRLSLEDRRTLELYVNGFADRIKEVDNLITQEGAEVTRSTNGVLNLVEDPSIKSQSFRGVIQNSS